MEVTPEGVEALTDFVSEALVVAAAAKTSMSENSNNGGVMPADACLGVSPIAAAVGNVESMSCAAATGIITITTTTAAGGVTLDLRPTEPGASGAVIQWASVRTGGENKHVPANCRV